MKSTGLRRQRQSMTGLAGGAHSASKPFDTRLGPVVQNGGCSPAAKRRVTQPSGTDMRRSWAGGSNPKDGAGPSLEASCKRTPACATGSSIVESACASEPVFSEPCPQASESHGSFDQRPYEPP